MASTLYSRGGTDPEGTAAHLGQGPGTSLKEIPYDYVATFTLEGQVGTRVVDVVNVSVEGAFVAVAIGYSFLPIQQPAAAPVPAQPPRVRGAAVLNRFGVQLPAARGQAQGGGFGAESIVGRYLREMFFPAAPANAALGNQELQDLFYQSFLRLRGFDFLYSVIDSGSGRELQNQPIHNTAGLGSPEGHRPFRPLAKPMLFMPRSTIRIEIIEQSAGDFFAGGTLYFVLHGYKILGFGAPGS